VLAAGWLWSLLHLLVNVATRGLLALAIAVDALIVLVALTVVAPLGLSPPLGVRLTCADSL
jgi:hypothetical protein